jgi:predicted membrane metal-binding protein
MIEYAITAFKDISFSLNGEHSMLLSYFIFGGIVMVLIGYWIKKKMGAFIALLSVLFAYLYCSGSLNAYSG